MAVQEPHCGHVPDSTRGTLRVRAELWFKLWQFWLARERGECCCRSPLTISPHDLNGTMFGMKKRLLINPKTCSKVRGTPGAVHTQYHCTGARGATAWTSRCHPIYSRCSLTQNSCADQGTPVRAATILGAHASHQALHVCSNRQHGRKCHPTPLSLP